MTPEREIFSRSRKRLNILGWCIFLALTLVFGSIYFREPLRKNLETDKGIIGVRTATRSVKQADLADMRAFVEKYRILEGQGLVGRAERELWVEQLVALRGQLGVGEAITYILKPPRSLAELAQSEAGQVPTGDADALAETAELFHDLEFDIRGTHERELLDLLNEYAARVKGRFRLQSCQLGNASSNGLRAQCTLRFFSLSESARPQ